MPHKFKDTASPTGLLRLVARAPIHLYRWHLGRLLGSRMLLLTHTGRISGQPRQVALEVVDHDPHTGTYLIASGFGSRAQWYRNVRQTSAVTIRVGGRRLGATAHPLTPRNPARPWPATRCATPVPPAGSCGCAGSVSTAPRMTTTSSAATTSSSYSSPPATPSAP